MFNLNAFYGTNQQLYSFTNGLDKFIGTFLSQGVNGRVWMQPLKKGGRKAPRICVRANKVKAVK